MCSPPEIDGVRQPRDRLGALEEARDAAAMNAAQREPSLSLDGCDRIAVIGRTGSGKTTLARQIAGALRVSHIELDSLYFGPNFSTVTESVLRERVATAISKDHWVTDGNKRAVRDLVWPRADTIVWLDYPVVVSLWRLGRRALRRTASLRTEAAASGPTAHLPGQMLAGAKGVIKALRSHTGQRREFPPLFAAPEHRHLVVVRLRSPRATKRWYARVTGAIASADPGEQVCDPRDRAAGGAT